MSDRNRISPPLRPGDDVLRRVVTGRPAGAATADIPTTEDLSEEMPTTPEHPPHPASSELPARPTKGITAMANEIDPRLLAQPLPVAGSSGWCGGRVLVLGPSFLAA